MKRAAFEAVRIDKTQAATQEKIAELFGDRVMSGKAVGFSACWPEQEALCPRANGVAESEAESYHIILKH